MIAKRSILFVCTANIFRSVSAEYCFKKYLKDNNIENWNVGSAGIIAEPASVDSEVLETLAGFGIDASRHQQRKLTREMLSEYDAVVGMAENHIDFMESEFNYKRAILFNDLAVEERTSVWDVQDAVPDHLHNRPAVERMIDTTIEDIHAKTPAVYRNASERF